MIRRGVPWLIACLCLSAASTAFAAGTTDTQALIATEQRWVHALETGDAATLAHILAPDFVDISWRGQRRDRAAMLAAGAAPSSATQTLKDMHTRIYGNVGIVNGLNAGVTRGRHWKIRFTDVFVKRDGSWQAVSAQETLVRTTARQK